ncbi:hypothetical protein PENSPDRAFT_747068 [Peniophora sp. CONT]|nr:hypothetical protein PENSPDRAFT_747068 [Peniophora sp. CONT]
MSARKVFHGGKRRLVLAFDLGTTYSGVSYAILDPGNIPRIQTVSRYPGQEAGDAKIPTIIYYDKRGKAVALGAEEPQLLDENGGDDWEDEPLKLEWFKLLLRPNDSSLTLSSGIPAPQLPANKTITDVYADFYGYLFTCARDFIQQTHTALGALVWKSLQDDIEIVLSHPNGWGGSQQNTMRRSIIQAGIVPDNPEGRSRITFVSEGEASLHYCLSGGLVSDEIQANKNVMIIDAGGGTVDISTYAFQSVEPVKIEEIAVPSCLLEGSVIVRQRAESLVREKLQRSTKFNDESYVKAIAQEFDRVAKKRFKGTGDAGVKFSNMISDRDPEVGIRNGSLKLTRNELCSLFDPAIDAIIDAVQHQRSSAVADGDVKTFFLVGGFAASEYLFEQLRSRLEGDNLALYRPDTHTNKAVAEGAVSFHIDHYVSARVARWTYGAQTFVVFQSHMPNHARRAYRAFTGISGKMLLDKSFMPVLVKGVQVAETREFRKNMVYSSSTSLNNTEVSLKVLAYRGVFAVPEFIDEDDSSFITLCTVTGVLTNVPSVPCFQPNEAGASAPPSYALAAGKRKGKKRKDPKPTPAYYMQSVDVVLSFGLTELKAELAWKRNGIEQRSPANVIYEDDFAVTVSG